MTLMKGFPMLKSGARLQSQVCDTQVIVVRASSTDGVLSCGGAPMVELGRDADGSLELVPDAASGTAIGKRYVNDTDTIEVLATKGGRGTLAFDGVPLVVKDAKSLPSSD